ncbi:hypothetical protein C8T65DRAFT_693980 [Cerioporus squamosus]|nr:hypothetical protein C8T65DRAFT_693980 [Cerioporus squamosus]
MKLARQNCGKPNICKVIWKWFARYCPDCLTSIRRRRAEAPKICLIWPAKCPKTEPKRENGGPKGAVTCDLQHNAYPSTGPTATIARRARYYTYHAIPRQSISPGLKISFQCTSRKQAMGNKYYRFHKPKVDAFLNELGGDGRIVSSQTGSDVVQRRQEDFIERTQHVKRCRNRHDEHQAEWMDGLNTKRKQHFEEIVKRLRNIRWDKEIDFLIEEDSLDDMALLPIIYQSSKLTPKSWEKVLAAVKGFLENTREDRLAKEQSEILQPRFLALEQAMLSHYVQLPRIPLMDCQPDYVDLAMMEPCKATTDTPSSQTVTHEDFAAIMLAVASRWEELRKQELREAICKHIRSGTQCAPACRAAGCRESRSLAFYHYPDILAHPCGHMSQYGDMWMFFQGSSVDRDQLVMVADDPYSQCRLLFALKNMCRSNVILPWAVKNMCGIIEALGLDPACATVNNLQKCEGRVRCVQCSTPQSVADDDYDMAYTWEATLGHSWSTNSLIDHDQWESVRRDNMRIVKKLEDSAHARFPSLWTPGSVWVCLLCVDWDGKGEDVLSHVSFKHNILGLGTVYMHLRKSVAVVRPPVTLPY